jgi:putative phosphoesterase
MFYMKRILVLSDSHGNVNNMVTAVGRLHPDMIIHLGDCWADAEQLHRKFPMTVMEQVPGNCDCRQEVQERILLIEGKKILICHGHTFNVKAGYLNLEYAAEERKILSVKRKGGDSTSSCSDIPTGFFMTNTTGLPT